MQCKARNCGYHLLCRPDELGNLESQLSPQFACPIRRQTCWFAGICHVNGRSLLTQDSLATLKSRNSNNILRQE